MLSTNGASSSANPTAKTSRPSRVMTGGISGFLATQSPSLPRSTGTPRTPGAARPQSYRNWIYRLSWRRIAATGRSRCLASTCPQLRRNLRASLTDKLLIPRTSPTRRHSPVIRILAVAGMTSTHSTSKTFDKRVVFGLRLTPAPFSMSRVRLGTQSMLRERRVRSTVRRPTGQRIPPRSIRSRLQQACK